MTIRFFTSLFCLLLGLSTWAFGQNEQAQQAAIAALADQSPCSELIRHGFYNHFRSIYTHTSASEIQSEFCSAYSKYQSDKISGKVSASYGLFGGSVKVSREQLEVIGSLTCSSTNSQSFDATQLSVVNDIIPEHVVTAYRECVALNSAGLKTATLFRESDQGQVTIALRFVAPTGGSYQTTITGISVSPQGAFTCEGPMIGLVGQRGGLGTQETAVSCTRKLASEPILSRTGAYVLADSATLSIFSDAGTVNRNFAPIIVDPAPTPLKLPVGTIIPFAGSLEEAAKMKPLGWWPADGSLVNDPQAHEWNGKPTPNLRDRFLVGADEPGKFTGKKLHEISGQEITVNIHEVKPPVNGQKTHAIPLSLPLMPLGLTNGKYACGTNGRVPVWCPPPAQPQAVFSTFVSKGQLPSFQVPLTPPAMSVVYLIKVK